MHATRSNSSKEEKPRRRICVALEPGHPVFESLRIALKRLGVFAKTCARFLISYLPRQHERLLRFVAQALNPPPKITTASDVIIHRIQPPGRFANRKNIGTDLERVKAPTCRDRLAFGTHSNGAARYPDRIPAARNGPFDGASLPSNGTASRTITARSRVPR